MTLTHSRHLLVIGLAIASLPLAACGDREEAPAPDTATETAIPVEPDGGIGDGAGPPAGMAEAIPMRFRGVWDYVEGACDEASDLRMEISPRRIVFYESVGDVTAVDVANDNSITVQMSLSGEGETWNEELRLELESGGDRLVPTIIGADGEAMPRKRCEA